MNKNLFFLLFAQFFSALADNMLFITSVAFLKNIYGSDSELIPYLQESFVLSYILLAPFVGIFADYFPKNKVMIISNGIKILGGLLIVFNFNIIISYLIVGIGAAIYSPAKYGILVQILPKEELVKANGMLEGTTIMAILMGVVLGGILIDITSITFSLYTITGIYVLALILNYFMDTIKVEHFYKKLNLMIILKNFYMNIKLLLEDKKTKTSIITVSFFWGIGSMLRLFIFSWIPYMFLIKDNSTPSNLMGVLSVGIVLGAIIASKYFHLNNALKSIKFGVLLGTVLISISFINNIYVLGGILILLGTLGGILVIPLNALIQEKGHEKLGSGNALAVQNFFENIFMLLIIGGYNLFILFKIKLIYIPIVSGIIFISIILFLMIKIKNNRLLV